MLATYKVIFNPAPRKCFRHWIPMEVAAIVFWSDLYQFHDVALVWVESIQIVGTFSEKSCH
jgi:hypothetical protein